jgi:tetratricopeptide (TPR) repeat protein
MKKSSKNAGEFSPDQIDKPAESAENRSDTLTRENIQEGLNVFYGGVLIFSISFILSLVFGLNFRNRTVADLLMALSFFIVLFFRLTIFTKEVGENREFRYFEIWIGDSFREVNDAILKRRNFIRQKFIWIAIAIPFIFVNSMYSGNEKSLLIERLQSDYNYGYNDSLEKKTLSEFDTKLKALLKQTDSIQDVIIIANTRWGELAYEEKRYYDAINYFQSAIRIAELQAVSDTGLLVSLADCYFSLSKPDSANIFLLQAAEKGCWQASERILLKKRKMR